jgi:hypothetical protein
MIEQRNLRVIGQMMEIEALAGLNIISLGEEVI